MKTFPPSRLAALAVGLVFFAACASPRRAGIQTGRDVRAVLEKQVREWNAGNLAGFMETYEKSARTRFASGGSVSLGWGTVFDRYQKRYGDRAAMGHLTFSELDITRLGPRSALAFGHWQLKRDNDEPSGLFSLILRKTGEGWRIVHDHTSSAEGN